MNGIQPWFTSLQINRLTLRDEGAYRRWRRRIHRRTSDSKLGYFLFALADSSSFFPWFLLWVAFVTWLCFCLVIARFHDELWFVFVNIHRNWWCGESCELNWHNSSELYWLFCVTCESGSICRTPKREDEDECTRDWLRRWTRSFCYFSFFVLFGVDLDLDFVIVIWIMDLICLGLMYFDTYAEFFYHKKMNEPTFN